MNAPFRRALICLTALLLAGCAATVEEIGPPVGAPVLEESDVITADGAKLPLHVHLPADPPKAIILALHGFNDYAKAFDIPGDYFAQRGIATYAYDQRGFGGTSDKGDWFGTQVMVNDAHAVAALLHAKYPGVKLFLLGESMGGAVAMNTVASARRGEFDGVILVATATWGKEALSVFQRSGLWFFSHTMAWFPVNGQGFHLTPTSNEELLWDMSRDPLVLKQTTIGTLSGLVDLMDQALRSAPEMTLPTLLLFGDRDEIVPPTPTCLLLSRLPARPPGDWRAVFYPEGYHMLMRDLDGDIVMGDVASWIGDRVAPLPSGNEVLRGDGAARERQLHELFFCRPHKQG